MRPFVSAVRLLLAGWLVFSVTRCPAAVCFDPFADATGSGGTLYGAGELLLHQMTGLGNEWFALTNTPTPPATGIPMVAAGSLSYPGLPTSTGNSVLIPAATGAMGRLTLNFTTTNGTVYFSFLLKVLDLSGVNTTGTQNNYFAGFGDTVGNQNATLLRGVTKIYTRRAGPGFNLGVARHSNNATDWVFDTTQRNTNEVLFVVGSYNYNNHTANLWINPSAATFGSSNFPSPTITATQGADLNANGIRAFVLGCRTNPPPGCLVDELRIGTAWSMVTGGPGIGIQPADQTLNAGTTAMFQVKAAGGEPLIYQWQKNGIDLANSGKISGARTASLSISNLLQGDAGGYSVKVSNAYGSTVSDLALLAVNDPAILVQPDGQALPAGTNAVFHVVAGGTGPLTYQWYKENDPLANGGNISGVTTPVLTVSNLTAADVGAYWVRVVNGNANFVVSSNANLYLTSSSAARRPNVIFILCDDLGYGDLGVLFQNGRAAGLPREQTPKLDAFAAEGLQLRRHYCPAPVCAPSRASLLLGVHQGHANVRDDQFEKELANNHTLASVLKTAGYATAAIGKWGLKGAGNGPADWTSWPTRRGFDYYFGYARHGDGHEHYPKEAIDSNGSKECYDGDNNITPSLDKCYTTDLFTARAKKWIVDQRAANPAQPFFLYLAFDTPHAAYELPTQAYPAGGGLSGGLQWLNTPGHMISTASGTVDSFVHPDYASATYDHDNDPLTAQTEWPEIFKRFATSVRRLDDAVGDLRQLLQDLAIDTNTLVVFTSDNGPTTEDYLSLVPRYVGNFFDNYGPFDGVKRDTWEGGIRMPTLVRWPGAVPPGTISQAPSQFQDWMPTFAELAGLPAPARTDGVSLVPTLLATGTQRPSTVYVEYFYDGATPQYPEFEPGRQGRVERQMQVIGLNGFQGVRYNITSHTNDFEIYDVSQDAKQATNLAPNPFFASLQKQMKDRVLQVRRPDPSAPRPYDFEFVPPAGGVAVTNGRVDFAAYEGNWPWLPDVSMLTAVSTGRVSGLNLSARPRETNYAIQFTGFIRAPANGDYTFFLTSDAGAVLRIHDATVIDDDFNHSSGEVSGGIRLRAGLHPFRLTYRHSTGTNLLTLKYFGPGIAKQVVPLSAFQAACPACIVNPLAGDDSATTTAGAPVTIDALANDTDDGLPFPLTISGVSQPLAGTAAIVAGKLSYTPNAGFLGEDRFTYTIGDGVAQASATVRVQVCYTNGSFWFPFNEVAGLATTEAGGFSSAQLLGYTNDPNQWVAGRFNRALSFDGSNNLVSLAGFDGIVGAAPRTCAAWIKTTSANNMPILGWGPNSTGNKWTFLVQSGTVRLEVTGGWVQGTRILNDGQWHHLACTFQNDGSPDVTDVKLFVDGTPETVLSSQSAQALNTLANGPVTIGTDVQGRFFNGVIDEVRIYNRALTASELATLFNATDQSAAAWHRRYFGDSSANWALDDDGDGMVRLGEYAFGGQPLLADSQLGRVSAELALDHLQVHFNRRNVGTHELTYQLQASPDLKNWGPLPATEISATPSALAGFDEVVALSQSAVSGVADLYVRVMVQAP